MVDPSEPEYGYTAPQIIRSGVPESKIKDISMGTVKIKATLGAVIQKTTLKPHLKLYEATATDETGSVRVIWFNQNSLRYLDPSKEYVLMGPLEEKRASKTLVSPILTTTEDYEKWMKKLSKR